jgi:hypothetical protein
VELLPVTQILAALAFLFTVIAFGQRLQRFARLSRPVDRATPKGSVSSGVKYAYSLGMMPWAKESTRLHAIAYLRGVVFHIGIFLGLALLVASPWIHFLPNGLRVMLGTGTGLGAIFGLAGLVSRMVERNLKSLSTLDDYFAVTVVSVFLGVEALWLFIPEVQAAFYLVSATMLVYAPLGKIRHCIYFAYSRLFYGKFIGSRAVLPHSQQGAN